METDPIFLFRVLGFQSVLSPNTLFQAFAFVLPLLLAAMESPSPASCWSNVVKSQPAPKPQHQTPTSTVQVFADSCKSSQGVAVAVVDANAIIQGGEKLSTCADKFVSVPEVLDEVRDPVSRHRLAFVPFTLESMDPSPEALNKGRLLNYSSCLFLRVNCVVSLTFKRLLFVRTALM